MAAWLNVNEYLVNYEKEQRESLEERIIRHKERASNTFLGFALLNGEGFVTGPIEKWKIVWDADFHITNLLEFAKIHRALGALKNYTTEPCGDGRTREVKVTLVPKDKAFAHFRFIFVKKLPKPDKRKGAANQPKCRLVTRVRKETILVCDNGGTV